MSDAIFSTLDFLPTVGRLAGFAPPADRIVDGVDQTDLLLGRSAAGARDHFHYFVQNELHAVRLGPWKLILPDRRVLYGYVKVRGGPGPELYHLERDLGEEHDVAAAPPDIVARLTASARAFVWPEKLPDPGIALPGAAKKSGPARKAP